MHTRLVQLFRALDRYQKAIPLEPLIEHLEGVELCRADVDSHAEFAADTYRRNLIHQGPAYQALILCWRTGQRSPIHDHTGAACAIRVIQGSATETIFDHSPCGLLYPVVSRTWAEGSVYGSFDADIHQMGNLAAETDLVTLHIYSPSLDRMKTYTYGDAPAARNRTVYEYNVPRRPVARPARSVGTSRGVRTGTRRPSTRSR